MLPERYSELLTAYVDGELDARQQRTVQGLLQRSPEARALLRQLESDAELLRRLPPRKLGADLAPQIVEAISRRGRRTEAAKKSRMPRNIRWPAWTRWAVAAAILLCAGVWAFQALPFASQRDQQGPSMAHHHDSEEDGDSKKNADGQPSPDGASGSKAPRHKQPASDGFLTLGGGRKQVPGNNPDPGLTLPLQELGRQDGADQLRAKLQAGQTFRVDLFCRDTGQSLRQLRDVLRAQGIEMLIGQKAQARLERPALRTKYTLYAENLRPAELLLILQQLGKRDRQRANEQNVAQQFGIMTLAEMSRSGQQQIVQFLGSPPSLIAESSGRRNGEKALVRESGTASPKRASRDLPEGRTRLGPRRRRALVLAYNEDNSPVVPRPQVSEVVKQFQADREPRRSATLQVVLVLSPDDV